MKEQKPLVVKDNQFHIINVCVVKLSILWLQVEEELSKVSFVEELQNNDHLQKRKYHMYVGEGVQKPCICDGETCL